MITSLARQSVIIKAGRDHNSILGNYECAYAIGVMSRVSGIPVPVDITDMKALHQEFVEKLSDYAPQNKQEEQVKKILLRYKPASEFNTEMRELLEWGLREDRLWQM